MNDLNKFLDIAPEVARSLNTGKPVVALESTIISHGMPWPQNAETALRVEQLIRDEGAVPATPLPEAWAHVAANWASTCVVPSVALA